MHGDWQTLDDEEAATPIAKDDGWRPIDKCSSAGLLLLYYADIITDILVIGTIVDAAAASFIGVQLLATFLALLRYVQQKGAPVPRFADCPAPLNWIPDAQTVAFCAICLWPIPILPHSPLPGLPLAILIFDIAMAVEPFPLLSKAPGRVSNQELLIAYKHSRTLIESVVEAAPMAAIQATLLANMATSSPPPLLVLSFVLSLTSAATGLLRIAAATRRFHVNCWRQLLADLCMANTLPLVAIRRNCVESWRPRGSYGGDERLQRPRVYWSFDGALTPSQLRHACAALANQDVDEYERDSVLKEIDLSKVRLTDAGVGALAAVLGTPAGATAPRPLRSLESLTLTDTGMGVEGMRALATAVAGGGLRGLESLSCSRNAIGDAGLVALVDGLKENSLWSLKSLALQGCQIGDEGLTALAKLLQASPHETLHSLSLCNLSFNRFGDAGIVELARAFEANALEKMWSLELGSNPVGDQGLIALAGAIKADKLEDLWFLDLGWDVGEHKVGDAGLNALAEALDDKRHCPDLKRVSLHYKAKANAAIKAATSKRNISV